MSLHRTRLRRLWFVCPWGPLQVNLTGVGCPPATILHHRKNRMIPRPSSPLSLLQPFPLPFPCFCPFPSFFRLDGTFSCSPPNQDRSSQSPVVQLSGRISIVKIEYLNDSSEFCSLDSTKQSLPALSLFLPHPPSIGSVFPASGAFQCFYLLQHHTKPMHIGLLSIALVCQYLHVFSCALRVHIKPVGAFYCYKPRHLEKEGAPPSNPPM